MTVEQIIFFILVMVLGSYTQTVTGFGMGMIVLGFVAQFDLTSITFASVIISLMMLANGSIALKGKIDVIDRSALTYALIGLIPALILGVLLLTYLSRDFARILQGILGGAIFMGGVFIMLKPEPLKLRSGNFSFSIAGATAGVLGGLFSIAGPPLVYQYYRQPFNLENIRLSLLAIFLIMNIGRLIVLAVQGELTLDMLWIGLLCVPAVSFATIAGRRWPPPVSDNTMRRMAFLLLVLIGISLMLTA